MPPAAGPVHNHVFDGALARRGHHDGSAGPSDPLCAAPPICPVVDPGAVHVLRRRADRDQLHDQAVWGGGLRHHHDDEAVLLGAALLHRVPDAVDIRAVVGAPGGWTGVVWECIFDGVDRSGQGVLSLGWVLWGRTSVSGRREEYYGEGGRARNINTYSGWLAYSCSDSTICTTAAHPPPSLSLFQDWRSCSVRSTVLQDSRAPPKGPGQGSSRSWQAA